MRKLENYTPTKFMAETSHYDASKADFAVNFIQNLRHTKGRWAGKPFELIDWQEQIVRDVFGIVKLNGYRQFNTAYIEVPKKNGKALALDTPVPTPSGWKTMGTLKVGDSVFDETGSPCKVVKTTDIMRGHKCYCLEFFNGEQIIADAEHQWLTNAWIDRPGAKKRIRVLAVRQDNIAALLREYEPQKKLQIRYCATEERHIIIQSRSRSLCNTLKRSCRYLRIHLAHG